MQAVRGLDLTLATGEALGLIGESGSGKTSVVLASMLLLPPEARVGGSVRVRGRDLLQADGETLRAVRWRDIACVIQGPGRGLTPVRRVGRQIIETLRLRLGMSRSDAHRRARELAEQVELDHRYLDRYPHQLSGGQQQRAMLALALSCQPAVLVLDEPTSGLDAVTKQALLDTLRRLHRERRMGLLLASHDVAAVGALTDSVAVLYAGMVVERGATGVVFEDPRHPYTRDLLGCHPTMAVQKDIRGIRGSPPDPTAPPSGCPYHPRCTQAINECATWATDFIPVAGRDVLCLREGIVTRLAARKLRKTYRPSRRERVVALRDVDLAVREGEVLGIVGETGSGKTTLARVLVGVTRPDAGAVLWGGQDIGELAGDERQAFRRGVAIIHQDPFEAVSQRLTVAQAVREPLDVQKQHSHRERSERVDALLRSVGILPTAALLARRAHELSGGQLQRVVIARALALEPRVLVADEPTSMLDGSEQAKVLTLLKDLQVARGMALIFISHDLALVRKLADRLMVLHEGEVVEEGPGHEVVTAPRSLVAAALVRASWLALDSPSDHRTARPGATGHRAVHPSRERRGTR